jgi:hypothetical protein
MRKTLILMMLAMAVTAGIVSAGYPAHYYGDRIPEGCYEVESWITDWHDMNPWGMQDPTGAFYVMGTLCSTGDVVDLMLTEVAWRRCVPEPWGDCDDDDEICFAWYIGPWSAGKHKLAWEEGSSGGFYYSGVWMGDVWTDEGEMVFHFDSLTFDAETGEGTLVQGVWKVDGLIFYLDDDRYTRYTWKVRERQTPYTNRVRATTGRVVP